MGWWSANVVSLGLLLCAGCTRPQVVSLVAPTMACPNQDVVVSWEVEGAAALRAERAERDWDEGEVPSQGRRTLAISQTTTFTLKALDARPEHKNAYRTARTQVPQLYENRAALATCDGDGKCQGSFVLPETTGMRVIKVSDPTLLVRGQAQPVVMCVNSPAAQRTCVEPGASAALDTPAAGTWTLEASLPAPSPTPPQLRIHLDLNCQ
ncbi:MAG TPA: hypothetical protein VJU61_02505 [Polyangiaceae bacterium]|nr:hypothetical protein [Polyangiaceae bacterium]